MYIFVYVDSVGAQCQQRKDCSRKLLPTTTTDPRCFQPTTPHLCFMPTFLCFLDSLCEMNIIIIIIKVVFHHVAF